MPYSSNLTYNILGAGGDNIGQVKVVNESPTRFYYLKDHLGSIRMTVDGSGNVVGYDDYYPYGMTMTGRSLVPPNSDSRYKFTGKERDVSTGLDYFGARYYDSWRGQWGQVDPMEDKYAGWSPYNYVLENPIRLVDSTGKAPGGNPDPTTFITQFVQSEFNSVWNKGSNIACNFTYNALPLLLDQGAVGTALWAPELSVILSTSSTLLTIEKGYIEGKGLSSDSKFSIVTTAVAAALPTKGALTIVGRSKVASLVISEIQAMHDLGLTLTKKSDDKTQKQMQRERDGSTKKSLEDIKNLESPISTYRKND